MGGLAIQRSPWAGLPFIRPLIFSNNPEARNFGLRVNPYPLDSPWGCSHSRRDLPTLKCRAGRAGCAEHLFLVTQVYLCIGADIDDQSNFALVVGFFGDQYSDVIRADMP